MVNDLLENLGLEYVTSTYDINFNAIIEASEALPKEGTTPTLLYYLCCFKRQIGSTINDVQQTKVRS